MIPLLTATLVRVIDKAIPDRDLAVRLKTELAKNDHALLREELTAASAIITAEARGSTLQRNWRPLLMLTVVAIIANNYLLLPYARAFGLPIPLLTLLDGLWSLLTLGVGGYVIGRSGEKSTANLRKPS